MKYRIYLIVLVIFPIFILAQNNDVPFKTKGKKIKSYCHKIDSISNNIYRKYNFCNLEYSYIYIDNIDSYKNVITTNYWTNSSVNFVFKDENLSYLTPKRFDDFRRYFYKEKKLNILVYLDNEQLKENFFKTSSSDSITYYKTEDYITTTIFFKDLKRFLILEYYFENGKQIKLKMRELDSQFSWDNINYTEFYYNNSKIVFRNFSQSLVHNFELDRQFSEKELKKIANETLRKIEHK